MSKENLMNIVLDYLIPYRGFLFKPQTIGAITIYDQNLIKVGDAEDIKAAELFVDFNIEFGLVSPF